ncbi:conserved hypothetical protein [Pediculus humanus corporis]|uniref:Protein takeout precursor n=1 Tax=Pediculus humanus subsp. corporis TaxID=121224 RepID=E0W437_PEDHC|nr:uncharacterized protein Phum_PHUM614850 [Pediculus humanus corporis]EEB20393.1 conserved hypothetical protein [Pediculus humanus corporis]
MKAVVGIFVLNIFCFFNVEGMDLGDLIPLCSANDPELNTCVKNSAQKLIPQIVKGVPLLKIPPLDPMISPEVKMSENNEKIQIDVSYKNVEQLGFSKTQIDDVSVDLKNGFMIFNASFPVFSFAGDYVAKGHIFNYQMNGEGKANLTLQNAKCDLIINFHVENDRIKEDSVVFHYKFHDVYIDYDHVSFTGDEKLAKTTAEFINENGVEIMNGFKPSLDRYYGNLFREYLRGFFEAFPYSILFQES